MTNWIKRMLRNVFGLVPYERVDEAYRIQANANARWSIERAEMYESVSKMSYSVSKLTHEVAEANRRNQDLMLRILSMEVGPVESMGRALEYLNIQDMDTAIEELKNGIVSWRANTNKSTQGVKNER